MYSFAATLLQLSCVRHCQVSSDQAIKQCQRMCLFREMRCEREAQPLVHRRERQEKERRSLGCSLLLPSHSSSFCSFLASALVSAVQLQMRKIDGMSYFNWYTSDADKERHTYQLMAAICYKLVKHTLVRLSQSVCRRVSIPQWPLFAFWCWLKATRLTVEDGRKCRTQSRSFTGC